MAKWKDLPPELKYQIFEAIPTAWPYKSTAKYAAVNREWQNYFEEKTFRKLVLKYSCLDDFRQIARGREDIIKHIWLRIQPPKYMCFYCAGVEPSDQLERNNQIFTGALWTLMDILSSWGEIDRSDSGSGLTLEITVHATGSLRHRFDCCMFDKDIYPCRYPEWCTMERNCSLCSLSRQLRSLELRGSICDVVRGHLNIVEELRTVENVELDFSKMGDGRTTELPTVRCVRELTIRPLNVRRFGYETVKEIAKSFGKLETFNLEPELF